MPIANADHVRAEPPKRRGRFSEPQKFLPVAFVSVTVLILFVFYLGSHIYPMISQTTDKDRRFRGILQLVAFLYLTSLFVVCYVLCIIVSPGEIPDNDPHWTYTVQDRHFPEWVPAGLQEMKKTGERRHCKWCGKYKPDRCHHCRVCKSCILKMDHHCPWIYNCVGFHNYKFFFLLLFYSMLDLQFMIWTMPESMVRAVDENAPFLEMFFVLFGLTLSFFMGSLVTLFFGFHIWLTSLGLTTIEFCEKRLPKKSEGGGSGSCMDCCENDSIFNLGMCGNLQATLGDNPLLWFLPFSGPSGDGLVYDVADMEPSLPRDLEQARGARRKTGMSRKLLQQAALRNYGTSGSAGSLFEVSGKRYHRQYHRVSKESRGH